MNEPLLDGSKILFITAAPAGLPSVDFTREHNVIREAVRKKYTLVTYLAASAVDFIQAIQREKPAVVHFSGHGTGEDGLVFQQKNGAEALFTQQALRKLMEAEELIAPVKLFILNACFTIEQADIISERGPDCIVMKRDVLDEVAVAFSANYYLALYDGLTLNGALPAAVAAMEAEGLSETDTPVFREGQILTIEKGIDRICDLLKKNDAEVKKAIGGSRKKLQDLHAVLSEFHICKKLHDQLHQAQMQFPNALKATRGDLTDDEVYNTFDLALSSIETALEGALAQLRDVAPTFVTLAARENRRLELLKEHVDLARSANQDSAKAGEACAKIGAHLKRDLPRINSLLTENAEAMDLTRLGDLFSTISAIISIPRPNKLLFQKEAEACRTVNDDLVQHIHLHNQWQKVDVQLWAAESALLQVVAGGDAEIFAEVWQDIEADLQQLTGADAATPWAVQITAGLAGVPPMIAAGSWQPLASKFDRLARDIRKQFLEVDKGLKTRAEQISELGKPLDPFLALIP